MLPVIAILMLVGAIGAATYSPDAAGKGLPKKTMAQNYHETHQEIAGPPSDFTSTTTNAIQEQPIEPTTPVEAPKRVNIEDERPSSPADRIEYIEDIRRMHFYPSQPQPVRESEQDSNATPPGASITKRE